MLCIEVLTRAEPYPELTTQDFALMVLPNRLTPIGQIPKETPKELAD
jgi:hypothetical protein